MADLEASIKQAQEAHDAAEAHAVDLEADLGSLVEKMAATAEEKKGNQLDHR